MARPSSITYEQIAAAADTLTLAGSRPTVRTIYESLGSVGNFGTITKHLQSWRSARQRAAGIGIVLPTEVQREILAFVEREVAGAKVGLENEIADNQRELADLATENERLGDRADMLASQAATVTAKKEELEAENNHLQSALEKNMGDLNRANEVADALRLNLAKAELKLDRLPALESSASEDREARIAAQKEAAVLHAQVAALSEKLSECNAQIAAKDTLLIGQATRIEQQSAEITELKVMVAQLSPKDHPAGGSRRGLQKNNGTRSGEASIDNA